VKAWVWAALTAACAPCASCRAEDAQAPPVSLAPERPGGPALDDSEPIGPLPQFAPGSGALVALGAELFDSPLLSEDGQVACATCHLSRHGYADDVPRSQAPARPAMATNTPSLLNVAGLDVLNWNGRFSSLEEQLDALIVNPSVQATSWPAIASRLGASAELRARFDAVFPDGVNAANARAALLAFERSLASPGAPFDRWLAGEAGALSEPARRGYEVFKSYGCVSCHQGALVGGNLFARLGVMRPYPGGNTGDPSSDRGRVELTGLELDRHVYRVPSLRNVALTAPYLHDGSLPALPMVVGVMASYQLGRSLADDQIDDVVAFLASLTGTSPGAAP
jgi:cytochrome c peroxidase